MYVYIQCVHACQNYIFGDLYVYIGGYRIMKVVFPYQNSSIHEFHQDIGEVINFKLAYEYIFVTVSISCLEFVSYYKFLRKILLMDQHCLFHTRDSSLFKLNLYQQWMEMRYVCICHYS